MNQDRPPFKRGDCVVMREKWIAVWGDTSPCAQLRGVVMRVAEVRPYGRVQWGGKPFYGFEAPRWQVEVEWEPPEWREGTGDETQPRTFGCTVLKRAPRAQLGYL